MFEQLFPRGGERSHQAEHTSPTHESGTPVSPHMPISQCIAGEVAGIGISIGYCKPSPPISVVSIAAAKPIYEDFSQYSLISVGPRDGSEEDASPGNTGQARGWNASGFLAAIFGIGIALSFWTPKNLWVIMGGFGLRRERRQQQKNREQIRLDAREEVYTHDRIAARSKGKGKQRAIEGSESEGESSSVGESTPLLLNGAPAASYTRLPLFDTNNDPKHGTYTRIGEEDSVPTSPLSPAPDNSLTTIEEDIEPRSLPRNSGFPLPGHQLRTEQPIPVGIEEVSNPDSEGQCPFRRRSSSIQIQPLPASINIPTQKPASIRRPRSQDSFAESPPRDSPASSYRSRSLPRAFAMRQAAAAAEQDAAKAKEETEAKEAEEARVAVPAKVEETKPAEEAKKVEETPVFNLIPATPATIPQEVRDAAEEAMKEAQEDEARGHHLSLSGPSQPKPEEVRSDGASIRSRKHSRANSLSDLKEEPEEVVGPTDGSLTVGYKGKQPAGEEEVGLAVEPIVSSPDQLSLHEDSPSEEPKSSQDDSPSHPPPPSRGGSIMDDGKSISSVDPKTSPSRKNSFRRMIPSRKPSSDTMKKEGSLRRSLTSVIPGGKSKKRDKSAPPSSASSQIIKLGEPTPPPTPPDGRPSRDEGEASIRPSSRRSERSISRSMTWSNAFKLSSGDKKRNPFAKQASDNEAPADATPDSSETVKPSDPAVPAEGSSDSAPAPAPAGPSQTADEVREEEKPKPASRRPSWWNVTKDLKRKNSIAQSVKGEEGVTRPSTAVSISQPEGKGKEVERVEQSVGPTPGSSGPVEADKADAPVSAAVEPIEPKANDAPVPEVVNGEAKKAADTPPRAILRTKVKSFMAWRK